MGHSTSPRVFFGLLLVSFCAICSGAKVPPKLLDDARRYVTRPDIEAPNFNVTIYDKDLITPGYWFIGQYDELNRRGGNWTGPHIFDNTGELIWSGCELSDRFDVHDFKLSNVRGEDRLTMIHHQRQRALIVDTSYEVRDTIRMAYPGQDLNMHELHFVENGTRVLLFHDSFKELTKEASDAIGFTEGRCGFRDNNFRELEVTNDWDKVIGWHASEHIDVDENHHGKKKFSDRCAKGSWDIYHTNSLDKFPDGSYLMSVRHTDTIYKIGTDGEIIWRVGGTNSDFEADFYFLGQHHARILDHNETTTVISFFDNADATPHRESSAASSRALIVALRTDVKPMTATIVRAYPHPGGPGTFDDARGSVQVLPNGNVFTNWVYNLWISEHTADGKLVMEAQERRRWLKSYRSYKFSFVGKPHQPPDVYSAAFHQSKKSTKTIVYVSWNGATEVATWNLYRTYADGGTNTEPVISSPRYGFETVITYDGLADYVVVEALDKDGHVLGKSNTVETIVGASSSKPKYWMPVLFLSGLVAGAIFGIAGLSLWRFKPFRFHSRSLSYHRVPGADEELDHLERKYEDVEGDERSSEERESLSRTPSQEELFTRQGVS